MKNPDARSRNSRKSSFLSPEIADPRGKQRKFPIFHEIADPKVKERKNSDFDAKS